MGFDCCGQAFWEHLCLNYNTNIFHIIVDDAQNITCSCLFLFGMESIHYDDC